MKVYCFLYDNCLNELFSKQNLYQREIAKLIGSWQGNVSKVVSGTHQLTIEQYYLLGNRISDVNLFNKIKSIRIGNLTSLRNNKKNQEFIKYVYDSKINKI